MSTGDPDVTAPSSGARSVEGDEAALRRDLERVEGERDDYLEALRRLQADFENYRKRMLRDQTEHLERAGQWLAQKLLPVLDAFDLAVAHHRPVVEPLYASLRTVLEAEGLGRLQPAGEPFDPGWQEALVHEPREDGEKPTVVEVLRAGYRWKGALLRPPLVKVRG